MAKVYNKIEEKIRDWLSQNLSFIDPELTLIEIEYHLQDTIGSKGYVDILAKDKLNNFVIIEIKRAEASARQAINEILKYHALIKQKFNARESEIRIIIISTHWAELIRPFSELINRTTLAIKGYDLSLDINDIPNKIEEKQPLQPQTLSRKFSQEQCLDLFLNEDKRANFINEIKKRIDKASYEDYVIIELDNTNLKSQGMHNYATVTIFQELSTTEILNKINAIDEEPDISPRDSFDTDQEYINHLHETFIVALEKHEINDTAEAGYPDKLDSIISTEKWEVKNITRFGVFASDPRYDDSLLLREARGLDGDSSFRFFSIGESTQPERIKEIIKNSKFSLSNALNWQNHVDGILNIIADSKEPYRLVVYIYNPNSTIAHLRHSIVKANNSYLPYYQIFVTYTNSNVIELYSGNLVWNGKMVKDELFKIQSRDENYEEFTAIHLGWDNNERVADYELVFANIKNTIENGEIKDSEFIVIQDGKIGHDSNSPYLDLGNYIHDNKDIINQLLLYYDEFYFENGN